MEALQFLSKKRELLPNFTVAQSSASFEGVKHRLKCLASPPTSIVTTPSSLKSKPTQSPPTVATPTTAVEPTLNISNAAASVLPLSKPFIIQKFHVSPRMPIDEKIQAVWNQQIFDRLSGVLQCEIPTGLCLQEFMMVGERPDTLRPTVIISCGDTTIKKNVEKIFKRQQWLHELLKANRIIFVALVAKTHLSAGPAFDDKSMLALSESYAVQVEQSELTTSCGLKLSIRGADKRVQQHCTLGGLLIVDGRLLGLTAGHPFRKIDQHFVEQDLSEAGQVADSPDDERSSTTSNEPFVFNGDGDDGSNDDKHASALSLPENKEDSPIGSSGLPYEQDGHFEPYTLSTMWHVPQSAVPPDSCPRQVSLVEDRCHDYDWQLLPNLPPGVTSRPNKIAHVDPRHNIPIEETVSGSASGDVIINIASFIPQLGYLHSSPARLQVDKSVLDVQLITLEHVLPLGSSGAWVLLGAKLCGYIIAVRQDIPWAYMVAILPVMKDIRWKLRTDDVRLPTAAEILSLKLPSKALNAGPSDVLGEDDRNPVSIGDRDSTSEKISKAPWQAHGILSELPSDLPKPIELPSTDDNYQAAKSGYRTWGNDNKTERANPTSLEATAKNTSFNENSNLPVQEETEPITEKPSMLPVASQPPVEPMAERATPRREPQRASSEQTPCHVRAPYLRGDRDSEASDRPSNRLWLHRTWRSFEAGILRTEYRRRRERRGLRTLIIPLRAPCYPHPPYDKHDIRTALLRGIKILWFYVRYAVFFVIWSSLYASYFIGFFPFIVWVAHRHRNVLADRRTLEIQQRESIQMLGTWYRDDAFWDVAHETQNPV